MPSIRVLCALAIPAALALHPAFVNAQTAAAVPTRSLVATRLIGDAPTVDGRVDDDAWTKVAPYTDFVQVDPNLGQPASEKTEVRVTFDDRNLYVGVIAFDTEPDKITYTQSKRDADLTDSDSIQFIFDTFNDHQNGFVFGTNPSGVEYRRAGGRRRRYRLVGPVRRRWGWIDARRARRLQRQLGCQLDGAGASHRARLGSRDGDSAQDAALRLRHRQDLGIQRRAQHPAQERAGLPAAGPARLQPHPGVGGRATDRARPAEAPRPQAHAVRGGTVSRGQPLRGRPQ